MACTTTSGSGKQTYYRSCDEDIRCKDNCDNWDVRNCYSYVQRCNGGCGNWEEIGSCSVRCGTGTQIYIRQCNNPVPVNNESYCNGSYIKYENCVQAECSENWGCWQTVGQCSTTCGNGTQMRVRSCDSPMPTNGGPSCTGDNTSYVWCNIQDCPVFKWGYLKEMNLSKSEIMEAMMQQLNELKANLTVDAKNTSAAIRLRTSARDDRPSAATFGYIAIILLSVTLTLIPCCDCTRIFQYNAKNLQELRLTRMFGTIETNKG